MMQCVTPANQPTRLPQECKVGLIVAINHEVTAPIRPRTIHQRNMRRPPALSLDTARRRNDRRRAHSVDAGDVISRGFEAGTFEPECVPETSQHLRLRIRHCSSNCQHTTFDRRIKMAAKEDT
ncbi:hypothetical protein LSAT2_019475 [Lamellibrachia satsuma]|nr:hypothetical protein LSAT2_019475 [Lamellibrachia satsuma]